MDRRKFIKSVAASAAAMSVPCFSIAKSRNANEKINVAFVGVGGIGAMSLGGLKNACEDSVNFAALCDVDTKYSAGNAKKYAPDAPFFTDYRQMLEKMGKDIDAVCVSTPDHSHFKVAMDSMECGKHVAVQKPLAHNVWQVRQLAKARKYYGKQQTVMMNQGHATDQIRLLKEWADSGICGDFSEVHVMCGGPNWKSIYFKKPATYPFGKEDVPSNLSWDLWINQGKFADYNSIYHPLTWRSFWDYGTGMLGDWFCHTGDAPVWILDLKDPVSVELVQAKTNFDPKVFIPDSSIVKWTFPKTEKHPECVMYWYDGGLEPLTRPHDFDDGRKLPTAGMFMIGSKHTIETGVRPNFNPCMTNTAFFKEFKRNMPPKSIPRIPKGSLYREWIDAIKGDGPECGSNFGYAAQLTEVALLGCLVQRFGGKIEWDAKNMSVKNRPELNAFVKEPERAGWETKAI